MWCRKNGNRSNVTKRVRKRYSHLNHMQIWVSKKQTRKLQSLNRLHSLQGLHGLQSEHGTLHHFPRKTKWRAFFLLSKCSKVNVRISVYYHWKLQHRIKYNRAVEENDHRKLFSRILSRLLPCYFEIKSISPRALKT